MTKIPQYEMGQYRSYENTILSSHIYIYIILYVNKGKCSGLCVLAMSRVCVMYICLVLNCFVFFSVYCAKHWTT